MYVQFEPYWLLISHLGGQEWFTYVLFLNFISDAASNLLNQNVQGYIVHSIQVYEEKNVLGASPFPKCVDLCLWHPQKLLIMGQKLILFPHSLEKREMFCF